MRLYGILAVARSGLQANQVAIRTAGHNIANVNTAGYSRQRATLRPIHPQPAPRGAQLGGGVQAVDLRGVRDEFVNRQLVTAKGALGAAEARQRPLQRIDALFNEMNGEGVHVALERFFNSMRSLETNPESLDHRAGVLAAGEIFTERVRQTAGALDNLRLGLNQNIADEVVEINRLAAEVADLNDRIAATEASGGQASDLRDRRQVALVDLGTRVDITSFEDPDGRTVVIGPRGKPLVEDGTAAALEVIPDADNLLQVVHVAAVPRTAAGAPNGRRVTITDDVRGGRLFGLIDSRDVAIANAQDDLDEFVFTFVERFNLQHRQGFGLDGLGNRDFFTPLAAQADAANGFSISDHIFAGDNGLRAIGASEAADTLPGDQRNALALADLQHDPTFFGGRATPSERLARIVRDAGAADRDNDFQLDFEDIKVNQLQNLRDTVSGVSLDEEMLDLVKFQNAFQASARVVRIVDEMLEDVVNLKR